MNVMYFEYLVACLIMDQIFWDYLCYSHFFTKLNIFCFCNNLAVNLFLYFWYLFFKQDIKRFLPR